VKRSGLVLALLGLAELLSGCRSPRIDVTVENRTGAAVELLEVDYPSASFGADRLAAGADYLYRFQVRGSGPVKVQYTELQERQAGSLEIVLLPAGKAEFHSALHP
jgi:hypothetical protein